MLATFEELSGLAGFSRLSEEARKYIYTICQNVNEDPLPFFCDECGCFCGDDYDYDFVNDLVFCPEHYTSRQYKDEADHRWYERGDWFKNREVLSWLKGQVLERKEA